MKRIKVSWIVLWVLVACWPTLSSCAIPQSINYQGRLTSAAGSPVNDTVDLVFDICPDSLCTGLLWEESHTGVVVKDGLFNALLGSIVPIPLSVFAGQLRWLSISVDGVPATRRSQLVSVAYAYRALLADTAYYAKSGGAVNCSDCNPVFVNVVGPDSVLSTSGTALLGKASGSSASTLLGIQGFASNSSSGSASGGYFSTSDSGTGAHFGVRGDGAGSSPSSAIYGVLGNANHSSSGDAYGGTFSANYGGTGVHYGVYAQGLGSSNYAYGVYGVGSANSSGYAYGGFFSALSGGTGIHYGLRAEGSGSTSSGTYGTFGLAENTSSGAAFGGWFQSASSGTGAHYGVRTESYGSSSALSSGVTGWASNTSTGDAYGGDFSTSTGGTGQHYGVRAAASASSPSTTYGINGSGSNASNGTVYGGFFTTTNSGTGIHFGARVSGDAASANTTYGLYSDAKNTSTGNVYSGVFSTASLGTGHHYGVYASSDASSAVETYGVCGSASNDLGGDTYGGYFTTQNNGTGHHNGVAGLGFNDDTMSAAGVYGYAENHVGRSYGGYFVSVDDVYGSAGILAYTSSPYNWAGYFVGAVYMTSSCQIAGNLQVYGSKNAAVKVDNGDYRLVSCQESPEVWFEDFGEGQLAKGNTHVELDPLFLQTVVIDSKHPIKVFVQLEGDCNGVFVTKGTTGFDVSELRGGTSNATFSYRIVAKRRGYEDVRLAKAEGRTPEQMEAERVGIQADVERDAARMKVENERMKKEKRVEEAKPVPTGE